MVEGQRRMAQKVRKATRKIDPDIILTGEESVECFIDVLDGKLHHYNMYDHFIPMIQAVYGDYTLFYGRSISHKKTEIDPEFNMSVGNMFVNGIKLARMVINIEPLLLDMEKLSSEIAYLKRLVKYSQTAYKFTTEGEMMRPLKFLTPIPSITSTYNKGTTLPVILSSVWKARDNTIGIVMTNVGNEDVEFKYFFDIAVYQLPDSKKYILKAVDETGTMTTVIEYDHKIIERTDVLSPQGVLLYQLETKGYEQ